MEERLQKILSAHGVSSRRGAETYLADGRVKVNGLLAHVGDKADPEKDVITVDGKVLGETEKRTYILLHKPRGYVTTLSDEKGRKTVAQLVADCGARVWPVGRLDMDSEGLLILTDDGDLTNKLTHPKHQIEKEYLVSVSGNIDCAIPVLNEPMVLDGVKLAPAKARIVSHDGERGKISIIIHEGKNRQVRRMCAEAGLEVLRLIRVREGDIHLTKVALGKWRPLTIEEIHRLKAL